MNPNNFEFKRKIKVNQQQLFFKFQIQMGNTQNKKEVQIRVEEEIFEPKPLMLLKHELLREFNFTPKLIDYQTESKKLKEIYRIGHLPEDMHPHILLNTQSYVQPQFSKIFETNFMIKEQMNIIDPRGQKIDDTLDQKVLRENHRQTLERNKQSILQRMQYLDPYDPYAHIKEFQKIHFQGKHLAPTNYNYGMNEDDLEIYQDEGYFTQDQLHYFSIFITYRFLQSHRQRLTDHDFWDFFIKDQLDKARQKKMKLLAELQKYQRFDTKTFALQQELKKEQQELEQQQKRITRKLGRKQTMYFNVPPQVAQNMENKSKDKAYAKKFQLVPHQKANQDMPDKDKQNSRQNSKLIALPKKLNNSSVMTRVGNFTRGNRSSRSMLLPSKDLSSNHNFQESIDIHTTKRSYSKGQPTQKETFFNKIGNAIKMTMLGKNQENKQGMNKILTPEEALQLRIGKAAFQRTKLKLPVMYNLKKDNQLERSHLNIEKTLKAASKKDLTLSLCRDINEEIEKEREEVYNKLKFERNILVVSWINALGETQPTGSNRILFFNNESLLLEQNIQRHFDMNNLKILYQNGVEVVCVKGENSDLFKIKPKFLDEIDQNTRLQKLIVRDDEDGPQEFQDMNQDNFFTIVDGGIKFIGVFDGHGKHGHLVSNAAMSIMLDYLRNKNDIFKSRKANQATQDQILSEIKKAFRYTQQVLLEDFQVMRHEQKKSKREQEESKNLRKKRKRNDSQEYELKLENDQEEQNNQHLLDSDVFQQDKYLLSIRNKLKKLETHSEKIKYLETEVNRLKKSLNVKEYIFKDMHSESDSEVEIAFEAYKKTPEDWCIENIDINGALEESDSETDEVEQQRLLSRKESQRRRRLYSIRYGSKFVETSFIDENRSNDSNRFNQNKLYSQFDANSRKDKDELEKIQEDDKEIVQNFLQEQYERRNQPNKSDSINQNTEQSYKEKKKQVKEILKLKALRKKVQKYVYYKRQIQISEHFNRNMTFARKNQLRILNHKPEIRFRANRNNHWQRIARKALIEDFDCYKRQRQTKKEKKQTKRNIQQALKIREQKKRQKIIEVEWASQDNDPSQSQKSSYKYIEGGDSESIQGLKVIQRSTSENFNLHKPQEIAKRTSQDERNFQVFDSEQEDIQSQKNRELKLRSPAQQSLMHSPVLKQSYKKNIKKQLTKKRPKLRKGPTILKRLTESSSSSSSDLNDSWKSYGVISNISDERDYLLNKSESIDSIHQEIEEQRLYEEQIMLDNDSKKKDLNTSKNNYASVDIKHDEPKINRLHLMTQEINSEVSDFDKKHSAIIESQSSDYISEGYKSQNNDNRDQPDVFEKNLTGGRRRTRRLTDSHLQQYQIPKNDNQERRSSKTSKDDLNMFASKQSIDQTKKTNVSQNKMNFIRQIQGSQSNDNNRQLTSINKNTSRSSYKNSGMSIENEIAIQKKKIKNLQMIINNYKTTQNIQDFAFPNEDKVEQMGRIKEMEVRKRLKTRNEDEFNIDIGMSGTTATLVIIIDDMIYYGWVGNSLCCISSKLYGKQEKLPEVLTYPFHTPVNQGEKIRIYNINKGEVRSKQDYKNNLDSQNRNQAAYPDSKNNSRNNARETIYQKPRDYLSQMKLFDPKTCPRVYVRGRNYPGISLTRSLGDSIGHCLGVLSDPSRGCTQFSSNHDILVVASQGVWNIMTPKEVFSFIRRNQNLSYGLIGQKLAANIRDMQMDREAREGGGQYHDITVVIVYLNQNIAKFK